MQLSNVLTCMERIDDIVYKRVNGQDMCLDLYRSGKALTKPAPLLVLIHGGGWFRQDKRHEIVERLLLYVGDTIVNELGWQVAAVEYRMLGDGASYPDQLLDCYDAVRFLVKNADTYGVDTDCIMVAGSSAGGYAATMMAVENQDYTDSPELRDTTFRIRAGVSFSGIVDVPYCVRAGYEKIKATGDGRLLFCMKALLGEERIDNETLQRESCPAVRLHKGAAPTLLICGTADSLVPYEHAVATHERAVSMGLPWECLVVTNAEHNFAQGTAEAPTTPFTPEIYLTALNFLRRHAS